MQSERWQDCIEIFSAVVERPLNARAAFLEQSCNGDAALRGKVELLLKYHDEAGDFIATPAFVVTPELLVEDPNTLLGQHVGYYRIDAILGTGGMGVVFLACDERLGRKVGLKVPSQSLLIDPARWERLKREARTASALNHPNIMTIHDVGEFDSTHYIATEFIEGATLREQMANGQIPPNDVLDVAIQIANALSVAHAAGIIHRDIKPENIMIRPDGYVKVLDFGIATFSQQERVVIGSNATTEKGMILGTARYMSPEQVRNQTVDARSDLWSLGVVLYEMLTACPPFQGETPVGVMTAVLSNEPSPIKDLTPSLQRVMERSLQKDPAERYQSANEMLVDLRAVREELGAPAMDFGGSRPPKRSTPRLTIASVAALLVGLALFYAWRNPHSARPRAPTVTEKSIAVLPFENLSAEPNNAFLADGLQDDVVTSLAKIKDLKVIARGSVMSYRGATGASKLREIGETLGVANLLQGSVRRLDNRVVVNVALIDARNQENKWAQRYERTLNDALQLQTELAVGIARELRVTLTPGEATTAAAKPTENAEAYLLYLRARELEIGDCSRDEFLAAAKIYQQAVDLDPNFALARARFSLCLSQAYYTDIPPALKARARAEAEESIRLAPELGEARLALAHCYLWGDQDFDRALAELNRAAEFSPNSAEIPLTAAFIYKRQNKFHDRFTALQRAEALDPRNRRVLGYLAITFRWVRNWPEAIQTTNRHGALAGDNGIRAMRWNHARDEFQITGHIATLKKALAEEESAGPAPDGCNWLELARYETAMLERDYDSAAQFLSVYQPTALRDLSPVPAHTKTFHEALLAVAANTNSKQQALELARIETESRVNTRGEDRPGFDLGVLYAFLGEKESAIRQVTSVIESRKDPLGTIEKNDGYSALALVYAQTGEPEKAIDLIEHLLTVPTDVQRGAIYNMTLTDLKWRWVWDPLRSHPRFQKLLASPEPETVY